MAMGGATTAIIGKTLAHKSLNTTQIYERMDLDPIRASMSLANAQILQAAGISPLSKTKNQA
jgi:site-specific recombinase XerD